MCLGGSNPSLSAMIESILANYTLLTNTVQKVSTFFEHCLYQNEEVLSYANSRIVSPDYLKYFHVGFDPGAQQILEFASMNNIDHDLLFRAGILNKFEERVYSFTSNRLIFPLRDTLGNFVGFGGRILPSQELNSHSKYINTPSSEVFSKSLFLYNLHNAIPYIQSNKYCVLVEGNMDAVSLFMYGIYNVAAPCGTAFTDTHALLLKCFTNTVIVCYDADFAGEKNAQKTIKTLAKANISSYLLKLPSGDPDSYVRQYGKDAFLQLLTTSMPLETS